MRLDVVILGALVVAGSASIFGDLGRAAPGVTESTMAVDSVVAYEKAMDAPVQTASATLCRRPGGPMPTSLRFLEPGNYGTTDFDTGCTATR
ncbi:hypothetical protein GCM10007301_43820 [Azorhizobium oxalatiphilum]|uniref:Uncharacterized protein n=1 Tax=Azorhizobium oxalatiphilum TaxID=980631 RepID=A0A917FFE4_9HYPH|nr:hypothetical protein [Azorhizobium oxalatiphilum]GGF79051.1 hypothetical protein GCM10007301_43820 [Azorhizobium oxalatiphilum]